MALITFTRRRNVLGVPSRWPAALPRLMVPPIAFQGSRVHCTSQVSRRNKVSLSFYSSFPQWRTQGRRRLFYAHFLFPHAAAAATFVVCFLCVILVPQQLSLQEENRLNRKFVVVLSNPHLPVEKLGGIFPRFSFFFARDDYYSTDASHLVGQGR